VSRGVPPAGANSCEWNEKITSPPAAALPDLPQVGFGVLTADLGDDAEPSPLVNWPPSNVSLSAFVARRLLGAEELRAMARASCVQPSRSLARASAANVSASTV